MPSIKRRAENDINDTASVKRRHISRPEESKQNENKMNMEGRAASSATSPTLVNSGRDEENIQSLKVIQNDFETFRHTLTCKICERLFYEPHVLSCGHTYCYRCLSTWLTSQSKMTCPSCREHIIQMPSPSFVIKELVAVIMKKAELLPEGETVDEHKKWQKEDAENLQADKDNKDPAKGGLFGGRFSRSNIPRLPLNVDGVDRCPVCTWELEEESCHHCGWGGDERDNGGSEQDNSEDDDDDDESDIDGTQSSASSGYYPIGTLEGVARLENDPNRSQHNDDMWAGNYDTEEEDEDEDDDENGSLAGFVVSDGVVEGQQEPVMISSDDEEDDEDDVPVRRHVRGRNFDLGEMEPFPILSSSDEDQNPVPRTVNRRVVCDSSDEDEHGTTHSSRSGGSNKQNRQENNYSSLEDDDDDSSKEEGRHRGVEGGEDAEQDSASESSSGSDNDDDDDEEVGEASEADSSATSHDESDDESHGSNDDY